MYPLSVYGALIFMEMLEFLVFCVCKCVVFVLICMLMVELLGFGLSHLRIFFFFEAFLIDEMCGCENSRLNETRSKSGKAHCLAEKVGC